MLQLLVLLGTVLAMFVGLAGLVQGDASMVIFGLLGVLAGFWLLDMIGDPE